MLGQLKAKSKQTSGRGKMSVLWQRLYSKWVDLRSQEQKKKQKLDFATAALILLQKKKKKRWVWTIVLAFYSE